jgi:ethanolamine utilization protein EutQ (cupin superfamily)
MPIDVQYFVFAYRLEKQQHASTTANSVLVRLKFDEIKAEIESHYLKAVIQQVCERSCKSRSPRFRDKQRISFFPE